MRLLLSALVITISCVAFAQNYNPLLLESSLGRGDTLGAIRYLKETLEKEPDIWQARYNLGLLLFSSGERQASAPHFSKALELNEALYEANYFLGHNYFDLDSMEIAIEYYTTYLQRTMITWKYCITGPRPICVSMSSFPR